MEKNVPVRGLSEVDYFKQRYTIKPDYRDNAVVHNIQLLMLQDMYQQHPDGKWFIVAGCDTYIHADYIASTFSRLDLDSDGDVLADETEGTVDTDGDGVPDYLDPDGAYGNYFQGGCTLDHSRGLAMGWLALMLPLVLRRRRRS